MTSSLVPLTIEMDLKLARWGIEPPNYGVSVPLLVDWPCGDFYSQGQAPDRCLIAETFSEGKILDSAKEEGIEGLEPRFGAFG